MIEARNLSYKVGNTAILKNVTVCVPGGEVTAVLGPNGAGKSTLLKCLTGAYRANGGDVTLDGRPLSDYSLAALAQKRAVLSQSNLINFPFTAVEIVMMGRTPCVAEDSAGRDAEAVKAALESVDAWGLKDRVFPMLSGGEQQRVQLARVLAQLWGRQNGYLFLDEPTSSLDLKHQHQVLALVRSMAEERNLAVCVTLHDLNLALRYTDRTILMKNGEVLVLGATRDVLKSNDVESVFEVPAALVFH